MKYFCIYTEQLAHSIKGAQRCAQSAVKLGIEIELYKSIWHEDVNKAAQSLGVKLKYTPHKLSATDFKAKRAPSTRIANGLTHYQLYKYSVEIDEPICILEHDVYFVGNPPNSVEDGIIQISAIHEQWTPETLYSCSRANKMKKFEPEREYNWNWNKKLGVITHPLSGMNSTSGYIVGPKAAKKMVEYLEREGLGFADRVREQHIGPGNLYLQVPQSVICDHSIVSTKGV